MASVTTVRFKCVGCGHKMKVSARHAGRKAKCAGCGKALRVPVPRDAGPMLAAGSPGAPGPANASGDSGSFLDEPVSQPGAADGSDGFDLDGFEVDAAEGEDDGYALAEEEPAWMKHAHAADAQAEALPKLGASGRGARSEPPSIMRLARNEKGGLVAVFIFFIPWVLLLVVLSGVVSIGTPRDRPTHIAVLLGLSLFTTLITVPIGGWRLWRAWGIMKHGVEVGAKLVETSTPNGGACRGTFAYTFNGERYTLVASMPSDEVDRPQVLIVDTRHPKRALRKG